MKLKQHLWDGNQCEHPMKTNYSVKQANFEMISPL